MIAAHRSDARLFRRGVRDAPPGVSRVVFVCHRIVAASWRAQVIANSSAAVTLPFAPSPGREDLAPHPIAWGPRRARSPVSKHVTAE